MFHKTSHIFLFVIISLLCAQSSESTETGNFIYAGCSPNKYDPNAAFQDHLRSLQTSMVAGASQASYNSFTSGDDAYGLYQCRNDLSPHDCSACVQSAVSQLGLVCSEAYAAWLQLDGCFVRYSNENFLGRADTTLAYRQCGAGASDDGEFFRRRDDVLADLQNGVSFRVSSSGTVHGYAQCLGDLTSGDCATCLSQAVSQLKNACGSALAADVFLAQCYARYWASGYYLRPSAAGYSGDDIGRTVAIIVGILAGVSLFVVFLSFLKKTC